MTARGALARTCTWNGNGTGNLFSTANNWSCSGGPASGDNIAFTGTTGNAAKSCTISGAFTAGTFTLSSGYPGTVTVSAALTVNSTLTVSTGILAGASSISVGGNFSNASSTSFTNTGAVTLTGTSSGGTVTSGGASLGALTVNGSGGTYALQDNLTVTGALTMSAGTLTAGSSSVTAGSVSLGGGTFNASSGTTQVKGAFSNTGGTFNANGGTVNLTGSGALALTPGGSSSFNALTISSGTYTLGSGLNVGSTLTIASGATLKDGGLATTVSGSWSNSGTFTSTGTVTLSGASSAVTIKTNGSAFGALTINQSGITDTLQDALPVTGALTLTAGTLDAATNNKNVSAASLSITAGSFSGGTGTVGLTGNLSMTGGTYTGGTGTATVGGNVSVTESGTGADPTLVGYWALDNNGNDSSGNGNTLSTLSGTFVTAVPSSVSGDADSLSLNGSQSASTANLSGSGLSELTPATVTLSAWYKAKSVDTSGSDIISGSNTYGLRITTAGITVMKRISDNTSQNDWIEYRVPETGHLDGNWHQIVGVITTGTGGGMTAYFDSVVATGSYYVNGSAAGNPKLLDATTTPTATAAAQDAIDWDANTETFGLNIGTNPAVSGYHFGGGSSCGGNACAIDEVRIYNRALTAAEVAALAHGGTPGGSTGVLSLAGTMNVTGSTSIQSTGTLTLGSGSTLGVGTGLTVDGTLNATTAIITKSGGSRYPFVIGSSSSAAPELNISGLSVQYTDTNGMQVNASGGSSTGASTTFTSFDHLTFSNGSGGNQALLIIASSLYLTSNGCNFVSSGTTYAVKMTAVGSANPRALFGDATCATNATTGLCATSEKQDSDANNDGVPDSGNGAVVQFIRASETDTAGTIVGYPTTAFNWNNFSYYSTYVAFHDASSGSDAIYMRDASGNPVYTWPDPNLIGTNESIVGTPVWTTSTGGTHYLYVAVNGGSSNTGGVYRLIDNGTKLALDTTWPSATKVGYYPCTCTITSDLQIDANNVYWAATNSGGQKLFGIVQTSGASLNTSFWPRPAPANVTTSAPTLVTSASMLYLGVTGMLARIDLSNTSYPWTQDAPATMGTVTGRVSYGTSYFTSTARIYAGDASGTLWAVSPSSFSGTSSLWSYAVGSGNAITDNYYDSVTDTVQFGTSGGKVIVLTGAGSGTNGVVLNAGYPYTLPNSDSVATAPLYYSGVLVVGSTKGNLYFLDRNTGSSVALIKEVNFGSTESVSSIGFDSNSSRFMVSTSSAANDGRLYYFDVVADPTASSP